MAFGDITKDAVVAAIAEYEALGADAFLLKIAWPMPRTIDVNRTTTPALRSYLKSAFQNL